MADVSATPLSKKLGIKVGMRITLLNAPEKYINLLYPLPEGLIRTDTLPNNTLFVQFFTRSQEILRKEFPKLKKALDKNGMLWISWPKGACGVGLTNLNENIVRSIGLENGLVDVKIAAVDDEWSGLKFVYRLKDRTS